MSHITSRHGLKGVKIKMSFKGEKRLTERRIMFSLKVHCVMGRGWAPSSPSSLWLSPVTQTVAPLLCNWVKTHNTQGLGSGISGVTNGVKWHNPEVQGINFDPWDCLTIRNPEMGGKQAGSFLLLLSLDCSEACFSLEAHRDNPWVPMQWKTLPSHLLLFAFILFIFFLILLPKGLHLPSKLLSLCCVPLAPFPRDPELHAIPYIQDIRLHFPGWGWDTKDENTKTVSPEQSGRDQCRKEQAGADQTSEQQGWDRGLVLGLTHSHSGAQLCCITIEQFCTESSSLLHWTPNWGFLSALNWHQCQLVDITYGTCYISDTQILIFMC